MEKESKIGYELSESPLSSEIISLPHGNRLENISPITECSDSELESCNINDIETRPSSASHKFESKDHYDSEYDIASQVKCTLQEHSNMLADKTILKDLLLPQNEKIIRDLFSSSERFSLISKNYKPAFNNIESSRIDSTKNCDRSSPFSASDDAKSYLSVSSTPKKSESVSVSIKKTMSLPRDAVDNACSQEKHVQFSYPLSHMLGGDSTGTYSTSGPSIESNNLGFGHHSFSTYSTDLVLNRLNEIKQHLDVNVSRDLMEETSPELHPLGRLFYTKLNSQKQRIKDLEDELALNEASLAKTTRELEIVQNRLVRREEQLKDAVVQLGKLQSEWQVNQQKLILSRDSFRNENQKLKQMLENVNVDREKLNSELKDLHDKCKNYSSLQIEAAEIKIQLTTTTKHFNEISDENKRINDKLKESDGIISMYEKKLGTLNEDCSRAHQQLEEITAKNSKLEKDFALLDDRHAMLLEKTLEEEQSREKAQQETEIFVGELNKLKTESLGVKDNLHKYYQEQLETIVMRRTQELQAQIVSLESGLNEKFSKEAEYLKGSHDREVEEINKRYKEELNSMRMHHESKEGKLVLDIRTLQKQNKVLQQQRQAILNAVTSVIPQTELNFTQFDQRDQIPSRSQASTETDQAMKSSATVNNHLPIFNSNGTNFFPDLNKKKEKPAGLSKRSQIRDPPLITSTSFSSVSDAAVGDVSSDGMVTVRERRAANQKRQNEKLRARGKKNLNDELTRSTSIGRRVYKASEIIDSLDTFNSDASSKNARIPPQEFLEEVDKTMAELVEEINSLSSIQAPSNLIGETPQHDTSIEQDSAQFTLKKIQNVSNLLANYVKK